MKEEFSKANNFIGTVASILDVDKISKNPKSGDYCVDKNNTVHIYSTASKKWEPLYTTITKNDLAVSTIGEAHLDYDSIFKEMAKRFSVVPTVEHKCHNCGGTLEMKANEHIFKCPYCKSAYAVGTAQINARY